MGLAKAETTEKQEIGAYPIADKSKKLYMSFMYVTFGSLLIGGLMGLLQTLVRSGKITLPWGIGYYQILTVHGVILALVMTTFFIIGFQFTLMEKSVGMSDKQRKLGWLSSG